MANMGLSPLIFFIILWDVADARYCYEYTYNSGYVSYYCDYYSHVYISIGSIVGAVIGSLVGIACLIGIIVFFCCIRPRRLAARGQVLHTRGTNVAVVASTTGGVQMGGGYINTAAYPPGTQPAYPRELSPSTPSTTIHLRPRPLADTNLLRLITKTLMFFHCFRHTFLVLLKNFYVNVTMFL